MTTTPVARVAAPLGDPDAAASHTPELYTPAGCATRGETTPGAPDQDTYGMTHAVPAGLPVIFVQHVEMELLEPELAAPRAYVPPQLRGPSRRWAGRR